MKFHDFPKALPKAKGFKILNFLKITFWEAFALRQTKAMGRFPFSVFRFCRKFFFRSQKYGKFFPARKKTIE